MSKYPTFKYKKKNNTGDLEKIQQGQANPKELDIQGVIIIHCHLTSSVKAYRSIHLMFARQAYTCAIHILARISACLKKKKKAVFPGLQQAVVHMS